MGAHGLTDFSNATEIGCIEEAMDRSLIQLRQIGRLNRRTRTFQQ